MTEMTVLLTKDEKEGLWRALCAKGKPFVWEDELLKAQCRKLTAEFQHAIYEELGRGNAETDL